MPTRREPIPPQGSAGTTGQPNGVAESPPNEVALGWGVPDVLDEVCAWAGGMGGAGEA